MKTLKKISLVLSLLQLSCMAGHAQVLQTVQQNFQRYNDQVLQEKIYTHTDKSFYLAGEIMWFKLYNVNAGTNTPVNISKVAYAEILDEGNNPVLQAKIGLNDGKGNGSFYLPVTLKNGNYKFRAYTSWMKNFSPELYFEKIISIVNPLAEVTAAVKPVKGDYDIRFFPEGGNMVNGITSTVAFKATGTNGKGMDMSGVIINQRNDTVVRFKSLKFGMGSFEFTPDINSTYKAVVRIGRDNSLIKDLPVIQPSGYVIHLETGGTNPGIKISSREQASQPVYLFAYSGHHVVTAQNVVTEANGNAAVTIDKEKLGPGINHFILFNSTGQPVCERLYFNRPPMLAMRATAQFAYQPRSPVTIAVNTNDHTGKPQLANFSVAVYKLDSLNYNSDADIAAYLWLGSELKGEIESPGYYFDVLTAETDKALDNLLSTQGWSRFKWADVLTNKTQKFAFLPELNGHIITGQLTNLAGAPVPGIIGYLGAINKRVQFYGANSDSTGRLLFNTKNMYGPAEIVVQTNLEKDSAYRINIASPFSDKYAASAVPPLQLDKQWRNSLEMGSIAMQVQNMYNAARLKQYYNPLTDSSAFYGKVPKTYLLDDFTRFITMEEVLREYVSEVNVVKQQKRFHIKVLNSNGFLQEGDPLVLLDGVPVFNIDKVFTIDPLKIKKLEMINHVYFYGPVYAGGLLSFTSYKGDMGGLELDPKAVVLDYEGLQLQREFYSPVYDTEARRKGRLPDFRNVLYWAPDMNTDVAGKAAVNFYTSDKTGKYIAVMQGLTDDGLAGSYYFKFEVKKLNEN